MARLTLPTVVLGLIAAAAPALAAPEPTEKPFLWKIETDPPSFLYGTIHLPDKRVTTLPKVVEEALDMSDGFFGELALEPELQMQAMPKMMLPEGQTLKTVLPEDLYKRLDKYCASKGVPLMALQRLKPWAVGSQLSMLDYMMEMQMGAKALDQMLYDNAKQAGKEVGGLETIDEQLNVFESLTAEEQATQLAQTMDGLEKAAAEGVRPTEELLLAYLEGDIDKIEEEGKKEFEKDDPMMKKLYKLLVVDRNIRMADRLVAKMKENPGKSYFFGVGTLHHPGEQGVIKLVEAKGYKVTRLTAKDAGTLKPAGEGDEEPAEEEGGE